MERTPLFESIGITEHTIQSTTLKTLHHLPQKWGFVIDTVSTVIHKAGGKKALKGRITAARTVNNCCWTIKMKLLKQSKLQSIKFNLSMWI
jgi:hypothetical protein